MSGRESLKMVIWKYHWFALGCWPLVVGSWLLAIASAVGGHVRALETFVKLLEKN